MVGCNLGGRLKGGGVRGEWKERSLKSCLCRCRAKVYRLYHLFNQVCARVSVCARACLLATCARVSLSHVCARVCARVRVCVCARVRA